jgi:Trk K+ transport system NAD-binding subunit
MDFTFGIVTNSMNDNNINIIIDSIFKNNIPNFEIIIVGNTTIKASDKITVFYFNETIKPAWITKKKKYYCQKCKI